jgi:hypothetical protein
VLDLWRSAGDSLWSFDVVLKVAIRTRRDGKLEDVGTFVSRQRYMRGLWRVDRLEESPAPSVAWAKKWSSSGGEIFAIAWDGRELRSFRANGSGLYGDIMPTERASRAKIFGPLYQELSHSTRYGECYPDIVSPRGLSLSRKGAELILDAKPAPPGVLVPYMKSHLRFAFDGTKGVVPTSVALFPGDDLETPTFAFRNELAEVLPGIWVPIASEKEVYLRNGEGNPPELASTEAVELDLGRSKFNIDIDPAVFGLPYPAGTVVYDHELKKNYIAMEGGKRDYEAYKEYVRETIRQQRQQRALERGLPDTQRSDIRGWIVGVNACLLVLVAATYFLVRWSRQRSRS